MSVPFPGIPSVVNGNGAVAHVMSQVCGGVIGFPITPSTEISELYEDFRAGGGLNVWGRHPFFFEPEGEHSAQSGALGAALTGGKYISNASSSQGILYGMESHYVTVGKKVGGFVLQVAARSVSRHSLNVMAGHDDVYALLPAGYTILFGATPQEAADLALIAYRTAALSLIPVANAMDGFATSHMMSEALLSEPDLTRTYLGDPSGRIPAPTLAQEMLFGAKGRVFQLRHWIDRQGDALSTVQQSALNAFLSANADSVEADNTGDSAGDANANLPPALQARWRRAWVGAWPKGSRPRVPALVDVNAPGVTGGVQNQPDFQAGIVDHMTHFAADVPHLARQAMAEFAELTGRTYAPVMPYRCEDAETVLIGLGSVTQDVEAVVDYLRAQGRAVGGIAVKLLNPFPEAEIVAALAGKRAVMVLERSETTALTERVASALFKARENAISPRRHLDIPALETGPRMTTAIFGLGAHDLQPRHLIAAFDAMESHSTTGPLIYLGSQFFSKDPSPRMALAQERLRAAYPRTEHMALETGPNPPMLPEGAFRVRFHSVGGYGTIATGKLLTDILAGALSLNSKSAPKYGSEKSGAPTNFYITLSPEPVKITNAEIEEVEIVLSPDHKVFSHSDPLRGLVPGGAFILQSQEDPLEVWRTLPSHARRTIREKKIHFLVIDAFAVARRHAPTPELETRMMGIAFIGALCGNVERITAGADEEALLRKVRDQIAKKFGGKGQAVVEGNMAVIKDGLNATSVVAYDEPTYVEAEADAPPPDLFNPSLSASLCGMAESCAPSGLFDPEYYDDIVAKPFREGTIGEAPVMPGSGLFMPGGSATGKNKGLFRRTVPLFDPDKCTGCLECTLVCPDAAMPCTVHDIADLIRTAIAEAIPSEESDPALIAQVEAIAGEVRAAYAAATAPLDLEVAFSRAASTVLGPDQSHAAIIARVTETLANFPVAKTTPFFKQPEKAEPGTGGLFSVGLDPFKCSGCLECVHVCGPGALVQADQDEGLLESLEARFSFLTKTPNTPPRFTEILTGALARRLILDRENYYATTGGHGACRGCGEASAIRLITAAAHALHSHKRKAWIAEGEALVTDLIAKKAELPANEEERRERLDDTLVHLEDYLYRLEEGPTGMGAAGMVVANATGCSSVYSSTFPFTQYRDPWVNSLFQDTPALAKGLFEGLCADATEDFKALRVARLERDDAYDPDSDGAALRTFGWDAFDGEELSRLPTVVSLGGDGATYDIGFGALSRLLATHTPIKVVVLDTGAYSNTGGQTSTASFTGQDSDLSRVGKAHGGKSDSRKELGLIAAFHPKVMVVQTAIGMQAHFLKSVLEALTHNDSPAVIDVYTPCQGEHGIGDAVASEHGRLAVTSRVQPLFVHDPNGGETLAERFSLQGNPAPTEDWTDKTLKYIDGEGKERSFKTPLTPADFAHQEGRFKRQFRPQPLPAEAEGVLVSDYIDLPDAAQSGKTPFIWEVQNGALVRYAVSPPVVALVKERRRHWRLLQTLSGLDLKRLDDAHAAEIQALKAELAAAE
jgi:pyruvate-ferredoxin/flavodoxin oxidoreductase